MLNTLQLFLRHCLIYFPRPVRESVGYTYGPLIALGIIVAIMMVGGFLVVRTVIARNANRRQARSGRQAFERLTRRV